jgi:hypothetical protein
MVYNFASFIGDRFNLAVTCKRKNLMRWLPSTLLMTALLVLGCGAAGRQAAATISLSPATQYQTISGWEATAQAGETDCAGFNLYQGTLFDQAVNDLGINRLRVELTNSATIPYDYSAFDNVMDKVVLPIQDRLAARSQKLFVNVTFVDFHNNGYDYRNHPSDYANLVLQTYQHLKTKYGFTPDAWEVILEADNAGWSPQQIGNAISAAASKLQANGFQPYFIAPSTTSMANAAPYFDQIIQIAGVQPNLKEISYHRYSGVSDANLQAIADRAVQYGIRSAMLELIGADYEDLHQDLKLGRNSAWQQYTLAYCTSDNGAQYYWIDNANPASPKVNLGSRTKFLRQYFRYVLPGAVRIGAGSSDVNFDPLAFKNPDGRFVVVLKAAAGGSFQIQGLPAGRYGIYYTTAEQYNVLQLGINLLAGQSLSGSIPAAGVVTVYAAPPGEKVTSTNLPLINKHQSQ